MIFESTRSIIRRVFPDFLRADRRISSFSDRFPKIFLAFLDYFVSKPPTDRISVILIKLTIVHGRFVFVRSSPADNSIRFLRGFRKASFLMRSFECSSALDCFDSWFFMTMLCNIVWILSVYVFLCAFLPAAIWKCYSFVFRKIFCVCVSLRNNLIM